MSVSIQQQVLNTLQTLSPEEQKMVLDFAVNLQHKQIPASPDSFQSFYDVAKELIGQGEGPGDLSTNLAYMEGYGKDSSTSHS